MNRMLRDHGLRTTVRGGQRGQVVVILLMVMVISLGVALSVAGRSTNEISNSTKIENSSRAFSAAEAGIERALQNTTIGSGPNSSRTVSLDNSAEATVDTFTIPAANTALAYPPFGKESFAQFWLANPETLGSPYAGSRFEVYFGTPQDYTGKENDKPGIEVSVVSSGISGYTIKKFFYDSASPTRSTGFQSCGVLNPAAISVNEGTSLSSFYCKVTVSGYDPNPVMARVRLLYSNISHPVALNPISSSLPAQASIHRSKGTSGNSQRTVEVFQEKKVMPFFFDYALFSAGELSK